ncbi:MAG: hemolysin family protein [Bacteroidales bacterium]|nr:hemolysin family protein [Bacteroidales bacterium]MDD4001858.1 hemolysin family protein [Bacteroidales bacterium]MDD4528901.1 hemolysin family protein [Bacteroidales bacterium]MDD4828955.1 hemolysin family protein [Bacteroidales bacterium]
MEIIIIFILIIINGLFSMSEIAVVSSRKSKLESLNRKGDNNAKKILKTAERPEYFLSTVQIAITAIGLITGLYSGKNLSLPLNQFLSSVGFGSISIFISHIIVIVLVTYVTLVLGELLPKKIGLNNPEKVASYIISPMNLLTKLTYPFVLLLSWSTNFLIKIIGIKKNDNTVITEDEIKHIINESAEDGEIQEVEQDIVERVFSLGDRDISSLMTHRNDFEWIDIDYGYEEIIQKIEENIHYIYPVADKSLDCIVGVVFLKDMFNKRTGTIRDIVREPQFLPESSSVYHALEVFKKKKISYALIIDEFGLIIGMVTMNDILESLVGSADEIGEVENEYKLVERDENSWLVDGQYPFFDFLSYFELEDKYQELSYNTLSGLILDLTGKIPKEGDKINWEIFCFEIVDMDVARIDKVLVSKNNKDLEKKS